MSIPMFVFTQVLAGVASPQERGEALVSQMIEAAGSMEALRDKRDVEYVYVYENAKGRDVTRERYRFDGELSWAEFIERELTVPELEGKMIQGWDGDQAWVTVNGEPTSNEELVARARFSRKTNFYWFAMMQKLADPGVTYEHEGTRTVNGTPYEIVRVGFEDGVGDAQDAYVLYIHPNTHLVDRFLFTVMAFGRSEPLMMEVEYEDFGGVKLPVRRRYTASDWEGNVPDKATWTREIMQDLKFDTGFEPSLFQPPLRARAR